MNAFLQTSYIIETNTIADTKAFNDRLELTLKNTTFEELQVIFMDLLNKFAPLKCK